MLDNERFKDFCPNACIFNCYQRYDDDIHICFTVEQLRLVYDCICSQYEISCVGHQSDSELLEELRDYFRKIMIFTHLI